MLISRAFRLSGRRHANRPPAVVLRPAHPSPRTRRRAPCAPNLGCLFVPRAHTLGEAAVVGPWPPGTGDKPFGPVAAVSHLIRKLTPACAASAPTLPWRPGTGFVDRAA